MCKESWTFHSQWTWWKIWFHGIIIGMAYSRLNQPITLSGITNMDASLGEQIFLGPQMLHRFGRQSSQWECQQRSKFIVGDHCGVLYLA
jgi:hypothetical protein